MGAGPGRLRLLVAGSLVIGTLVVAAPVAAQSGELAAVREQAEQAAQRLGDAETRLAELETEVRALEYRSEQAQAIVGELQASVRSTAVRRYVAGEAPDAVLLSGSDLTEGVQAAALTRFLIVGDQDAIDRYRAVTEDLQVAAGALDEARADQRAAIALQRQEQVELEAQLARLHELERQRQAEQQRRQHEEERLRAAEAQAAQTAAAQAAAAQAAAAQAAAAQAAVAQAAVAQAAAPAPSDTRTPAPDTTAAPREPPTTPAGGDGTGDGGSGGGAGGVIALRACPVAGPMAFVDTWGAPRSGGRRHQGVDMMSPRGTPVVAPVPGRVEHRGNSLGGLSYHLYGDDGHYYYGTHLSAYGQGGRVPTGTVIGYVGDTGNATTPHLHFEIHPYGGAAINPYPFVRAAC